MTDFKTYSNKELRDLKANLEKVSNQTAVADLLNNVNIELQNREEREATKMAETAKQAAGIATPVKHSFKQDFGKGNVSYYHVFGELRGLLKVEVVRFTNNGNAVEMYTTSVKESDFLNPKVKEGQQTAQVDLIEDKEYDEARTKAENIIAEYNKQMDTFAENMARAFWSRPMFHPASLFRNPFWHPFALGF